MAEEASSLIRNMSRIKVGGIVGIAVLLISLFVMLTLRVSSGGMVPLYTGLSLEDSSKIVAELEKSSVPYELVSGGSQIMVPSDRVLRLRMGMAEQGLPSGGSVVGYEIFDRSETLGSSSFVMNVNMVRALEGELSRTIASLSGVDSARVHLVMPKQEIFSRDKEKSSASVTVRMRGGKNLEASEVTAITHLIASASPGLEASHVAVIDGHGRLLARGDGDDGASVAAANAQEYRVTYETRTQQSLEELLEKVIGPGKVRVQVAADFNFESLVTNSEKYDPDGQVARSVQSNGQKEASQDKAGKDNVSVANNLPGAAGAGGDNSNSTRTNENTGETTNYEISKTVSKLTKEGGTLNKVSIAVLLDGTYVTKADGTETYTPRTEEELKQVKTLISSAIGYDEKRGDKVEVVNMRFTQEGIDFGNESFFERFKLEMQSIIQTLIIAVVAILGIVLVLRPAVIQLIKQTQSPSNRVSNEMSALEGPPMAGGVARLPGMPDGGGMMGGGGGGDAVGSESEMMVDVANIKGGMKSSSMKKVNEIVDKYPEETMNVLRQWILKQS